MQCGTKWASSPTNVTADGCSSPHRAGARRGPPMPLLAMTLLLYKSNHRHFIKRRLLPSCRHKASKWLSQAVFGMTARFLPAVICRHVPSQALSGKPVYTDIYGFRLRITDVCCFVKGGFILSFGERLSRAFLLLPRDEAGFVPYERNASVYVFVSLRTHFTGDPNTRGVLGRGRTAEWYASGHA